jgi:hypothetical protein
MLKRWSLACRLLVVLLLATFACQERSMTAGAARSDESADPGGSVGLKIRADRISYRTDQHLMLDLALVNLGHDAIVVHRRIRLGSEVWLQFQDSAGNQVPIERRTLHARIEIHPALSSNAQDFLRLGPGYFYGVRLLLRLRDYGIMSPGGYSLAASYRASDDGRNAGVKAFRGSLVSDRVRFTVSK